MRKKWKQMIIGSFAAALMISNYGSAFSMALNTDDNYAIRSESEVIRELLSQNDEGDSESASHIKAILYGIDEYGLRSAPGSEDQIAVINSGQQMILKSRTMREDGAIWYQVSVGISDVSYTGYIPEQYVLCIDSVNLECLNDPGMSDIYVETDDELFPDAVSMYGADDFESAIAAFPDSYKDSLRKLHSAHPNWVFVPQITKVDWNKFITAEMVQDRSLVERSMDDSYKGKQSWAYNPETGEYYGRSGYNWVQASQEAVEYFADPRNFLKERDIFQFELLTYNSNYQTEAGVEAIISGTFMSNTMMPDDIVTYAKGFCLAGAQTNVSPYMLAARVRQEQGGAGTSPLISGNYPGYEGYYNFFNIHAYGNTEEEIYINGLSYARDNGWTSRYNSIAGGANVLGSSYITKGQDTLYLQKFDVDNSYYGLFSHQYMQNIRGAYNEGRTAYQAYSNMGILNNNFVFKIPVYQNMPLTACPMPENSSRKKQIEDFISRLYVNILGRQADASGMQHWYNCLTIGGESAAAVSVRFVFSQEFIDQKVTDEDFVERMYKTMLGRGSDPSGKAHWLEVLNIGYSRRYVLARFVASQEFANICDSYEIEKGSVDLTEPRDIYPGAAGFVRRLYLATLKRNADVDGLNHWVSLIGTKSASPYDVAERIVNSQEFKNYQYSDEEYVKILYRAFLDRDPDPSGYQHWLNRLASGASREDILHGFANSAEFKNLAASYGI
ncbi:MAG: DUF4214 domain-containing protein [Lachnospiraceae bacterium]|nr:DUF4214 domain-containing protein [Lachnospiraceae bacterium]